MEFWISLVIFYS